MDNSLKNKDLLHTAAERGNRDDNKTQPKTTDSLRQGASQGAPTLRYGPAGDSAPQLRLKASVCIPAGRLSGQHAGRTSRRGELRAESLHSRPTRQVAACVAVPRPGDV